MQIVDRRITKEIEHLKEGSNNSWFKEYIRDLLESEQPYYEKADVMASGFSDIERKIEYLDDQIQSLQSLKTKLKISQSLGKEIIAQVLGEYGIDKIEGLQISSITITPAKTKEKQKVSILDPDALMNLGYVTKIVDEKMLKEKVAKNDIEDLAPFLTIETIQEHQPEYIKINKKRSSNQWSDQRWFEDVAA